MERSRSTPDRHERVEGVDIKKPMGRIFKFTMEHFFGMYKNRWHSLNNRLFARERPWCEIVTIIRSSAFKTVYVYVIYME